MTDLRKLLIEARELIAHRPNCEYGYDCNAQGCTCEYEELRSRIDAALAEKVEPVAWMADDGRVINAHTKESSLPKSTVPSFHIPLYAAAIEKMPLP